MGDMKMISWGIYDPSERHLFHKPSANDKAQVNELWCSGYDRCSLYAKGQCKAIGAFGSCHYGRKNVTIGYTKRARKFYTWIKEQRDKLPRDLKPLKSAPEKIAVIGDFVWIPYSHANSCKDVPFTNRSKVSGEGNGLVKVEDFNADVVASLANHIPYSWFGGQITSYQRESVPLMLAHISEEIPEVWASVVDLHPDVSARIEAIDYVGRRATLETLTPNIGSFQGWLWDGEWLSKNDESVLGAPGELRRMLIVKCKPPSGYVVKVSDNKQVNSGTVLID